MTKNKKTKAKAPAQARVIMEVAQPVPVKPAPKAPAKTKANVAAEPVKPVIPAKPVASPKAGVTPKPVESVKPVQAAAKPEPVVKPAPAPVRPVEPAKPVAPVTPAQPKVRLEISKPGAQSVAVAGSFNSWQPEQASATGNGGWVKELTIGPGRYEYMFVVDGQWMADPNAKEFTPNPFGGQNSVLVINK